MGINDAANILAGFSVGSKDVAETVLSNAGYTSEQIISVSAGYYLGEPQWKPKVKN
tara:strand:+ start:1117 stop:1284 length:168 start_codon:yes stop_codon:yes gene_type:complete